MLGALLLWGGLSAAGEPVDRIVAIIDDRPVLESQLAEEMLVYGAEPSLRQAGETELRRLALKKLVDDQILMAKARDDGLGPTEDEVEDALQSSLARMKGQFPTEEEFHAALAAEGITEGDLRKRYRDEVKKSLTIRMLIERDVRRRVDVTEEEIRRFYEDYLVNLPIFPERYILAQIFIEPDVSVSAESLATEELLSIRSQVEEGADFGDLANQYSDGPSATAGGDLGFFTKGDMHPSFEAACFTLTEPGDMSDVVQTPFGLHLIQLVTGDGERIRVRHILKKLSGGDEERALARDLATAIRDSISSGVDFTELARRHSDHSQSAASGGNLGTYSVADLTPDVREALAGVPEGGVSDVIDASDGLHIFHIIAHHDEGKPSFAEVEDEIRATAAQARQQEVLDDYLEKLRHEVLVDILIES